MGLGVLSIFWSSILIFFCDNFGIFALIITVPFLCIVTPIMFWCAKRFTTNSRILKATILAPSLIVTILYISFSTYTNSPTGTFKRHFGEAPPHGTTIIDYSGYTAMTGAFEVLIFKMEDDDLKRILEKNSFAKDEDGISKEDLAVATKFGLHPDNVYTIYGPTSHHIIMHDNKTGITILIYSKI